MLIIIISSKILLLFDKNLMIVFEEVLNISKNILGIFSGCFFKMFNCTPNTIINFLSNKSNIFEDVSIILKMPKFIFIKELF